MSIVFDENKRVFKLDTEKSSYAFHITDSRNLLHLYYGGYIPETDITHMLRIPNDEPFVPAVHDAMGPHSFDCAPIEFPTSGVADFREPAMQVMDINGMSACECYYKDYRISNGKPKLKGLPATYAADDEAQTLEVFCYDPHSGLDITLMYSVFPKFDVITRSVKVENNGLAAIDLRRIISMSLDLDRMDYDMITLHGTWARERHVQRFPIRFGKQSIDSNRGATSHAHNNFFALCDHTATEDFGEAYGFALVYSGSFLGMVEVGQYEKTRALLGINPYDFSWHLEPGEDFQAPEVIMTYSGEGLGQMSRNFHDLVGSVHGDLYGLTALDAHAHNGKEPLQVGALLAPGQLHGAGELLGLLHQQAGRPSVETIGVGNGVLELNHIRLPLLYDIEVGQAFLVRVMTVSPGRIWPSCTFSIENSSPLLTTMGVARSKPSASRASLSKESSSWPRLTLSPSFTWAAKCLPLRETVSLPTWTSSSAPPRVRRHTAWWLSIRLSTVPSAGAKTLPSEGITAMPSPRILSAKVLSDTCSIPTTVPARGLPRRSTPGSSSEPFLPRNQEANPFFSDILNCSLLSRF